MDFITNVPLRVTREVIRQQAKKEVFDDFNILWKEIDVRKGVQLSYEVLKEKHLTNNSNKVQKESD